MLWLMFVSISWIVEYRYSWIRFMWTFKTYGINFFFLFLGSCVIRKLLHSSWWELEKNLCGLEVGWAKIITWTVSFLLVCVCLWVEGWAGFGLIRHQILFFYDHFHYCEIFLARFLISFVLTKRPLHLVINKAASIVLNRILSLHIVWFSLTKICVVTEQMRDKTVRKVNKWPVTIVTLRFSQ